jgi:hypothetical protein
VLYEIEVLMSKWSVLCILKVRDLEGELDGMRRKSRDVLQRAVLLERERVTSLQWELEESRVALQSAEETAQSELV